jgi:hypothetical protein
MVVLKAPPQITVSATLNNTGSLWHHYAALESFWQSLSTSRRTPQNT